MSSAKSETRAARINVLEVISNESDGKMAGILAAVIVGMSNQNRLVVIVNIAVGDSDPVRAVGHVNESIVVVLAVSLVGRNVNVVNPNVLGVIDTDGIASFGDDFGDFEVPKIEVREVEALEKGNPT